MDLGTVEAWLQQTYGGKEEDAEDLVKITDRQFLFKYSQQLYDDPEKQRKLRLACEKEVQRWNDHWKDMFFEAPVTFSATYALKVDLEDARPQKGSGFDTKRAPAWPDRVLFTQPVRSTEVISFIIASLTLVLFPRCSMIASIAPS